jgi:hypothetical protein
LFFCQFSPELARIPTALIPSFDQVFLIRSHLLGARFSVEDTHPPRGLIHLQIVIDRATRQSELVGNVSDIGVLLV